MQISGFLSIFLVGCFGGFIAELLKWYGVKDSGAWPTYLKSWLYWIITTLMILVGGVLAILYGITPRNALLVVNIGASAPLIVASLARNMPKGSVATPLREAKPSVRSVLAGR
jgi:hypothetical protein